GTLAREPETSGAGAESHCTGARAALGREAGTGRRFGTLDRVRAFVGAAWRGAARKAGGVARRRRSFEPAPGFIADGPGGRFWRRAGPCPPAQRDQRARFAKA